MVRYDFRHKRESESRLAEVPLGLSDELSSPGVLRYAQNDPSNQDLEIKARNQKPKSKPGVKTSKSRTEIEIRSQHRNSEVKLKSRLEAFEDDFSYGFVGFDGGVSFAQVFGVDASGGGAKSGADEAFIDKCRYLFEDAVLLDHVWSLKRGAAEHGFPVQGCGLCFEFADIDERGIVDEGEGALGGDEFDDFVEVLVGVSDADDVFDEFESEFVNLFAELL
jgi:hypothetical protein